MFSALLIQSGMIRKALGLFLFQSMEYLIWLKKSRKLHGIHGPFLYQFLKDCVFNDYQKEIFTEIENQRELLLSDTTVLKYTDFGAGSRLQKEITEPVKVRRRVKDLAYSSLKSKKYCRLFHRISNYLAVKRVLELGTSFGITTSYLACSDQNPGIQTIEGGDAVAQRAKTIFDRLNLKNIQIYQGEFSEMLAQIIKHQKYDMIIVDGNHKGREVWNYFNLLQKHMSEEGVFIIDDIRWSKSMLDGWKKIILHKKVTLSLDFFDLGMVFFNTKLSKENMVVRF